jgi:hypothetical protein
MVKLIQVRIPARKWGARIGRVQSLYFESQAGLGRFFDAGVDRHYPFVLSVRNLPGFIPLNGFLKTARIFTPKNRGFFDGTCHVVCSCLPWSLPFLLFLLTELVAILFISE